MLKLLLAATAACTLLSSGLTAQGSFTQITPGGGTFDQSIGISPDGEYVVGGGGIGGFIWSEGGGLVTGFGTDFEIWGINDNGGTAVGTAINGANDQEGATWTPGGGLSFEGNPGGVPGCDAFFSHLNGVSADGATAVGMSWQGCQTSPMKWTQGGGVTLMSKQDPGSSARCYAVSDDGQVAVGWDQGVAGGGGGGSRRASVWLDDNTQVFPTTAPGNLTGIGEVTDVNSDGSVMCGASQNSAFLWTESGGLQVLPKVPGQGGTHTANGVSEDGSVVVGVYFLGGFPPSFRAFIWTEATGTLDLGGYMNSLGFTGFPVGDIDNATGVSADGKRICGWGGDKAWLVEFDGDGPWADLGNALAGVAGEPALTGTGDLTDNSPLTLALTDAAPSAAAYLVVGFSELNGAFKSGTLVPNPDLVFNVGTTAGGTVTLPATWPAGVPSAVTTWFQVWTTDAVGPSGFSASNGLSGTTP